ncbi:MAG: molecular chaperone TorD family protein [Acidimicrobiia bacterium]
MSLEDLSRLRQGVYRLAGAGFSPPDDELIAGVGGATPVLDALGLFDYAFAPAIAEAVDALTASDTDSLAVAYVTLFEAGVGGAVCSPYESAHLGDSRTGEVAQIQAELKRTYLRYGLRVDEGSAGMIDHVATEMNVMATLCELGAERESSGRNLDRLALNQLEFLSDHLLRWVPQFTAKIQTANRHRFYTALAEAVHSFLEHERQLVPLIVDALAGANS